jgi:hypothetical protein
VPTFTGSGTDAPASLPAGAVPDSNFVIPPIYGPVSNGPGGAAMTPSAFPVLTSFTTANRGASGGYGLEWPLIGGWLRVEVRFTPGGAWVPVTQEWLQLGFARGLQVPTQPGFNCTNIPVTNSLGVYGCNWLQDHQNAILYFQVTADRDGDGTTDNRDQVQSTSSSNTSYTNYYGSMSQYNWYPINFYDAREGENYDSRSATFPYAIGGCSVTACTPPAASVVTGTANGIMNAVELDVGNLNNWLLGNTGSTGTSVDFDSQNGYVLYFSDRRGMEFASNSQGSNYQQYWGEYGFEDTVNYANAANKFAPDGVLDGLNYNGVSDEDLNGNGLLDNYGVEYVGDAFGPTTTADTDTAATPSPYKDRFNTFTVGRANRVTGARHVLKLVDGSIGNLPTMPPGNTTNNCSNTVAAPTSCGGFTVASENPVYIQGNYNSNCPASSTFGDCTPNNLTYDTVWNPGGPEVPHAAASIIADTVTMLSNNWQDAGCVQGSTCSTTLAYTTGSLLNLVMTTEYERIPATSPDRIAVTTYYRMAVAAGKNIAFLDTNGNPDNFYGQDGGPNNFLRFLEDWGGLQTTYGGSGSRSQLYYMGSLVSLYWSYYNTGSFKCCGLVYAPPDRHYTFDSLFSQPQNLPPGTPLFRNVDNLTYRQNQGAQTSNVSTY